MDAHDEHKVREIAMGILNDYFDNLFRCPNCKTVTQAIKFSAVDESADDYDPLTTHDETKYRCLNCNKVFVGAFKEVK